MRAVKGSINEALRQVAAYNSNRLAEAAMSKKQSLEDYAKAVGVTKQEQQWIVDNEDDFGHYHNNSALKKSWLSLSYPVYDGDYYFAFIGDNERENSKLNAEANRKLRQLAKSSKLNVQIFDEMSKLFDMTAYSNVGAGDTMTRDELWRAIQHIRKDYKEEAQIEGWEELEEKVLKGKMAKMARSLLDKMRKRAKKIELPESLEEARIPNYKPTKFEGKEFDRKKEIRSLKNMQKAIHKVAKMQDEMQYTAETGGSRQRGNPHAIYESLVNAEQAIFDYMGGIERGYFDGIIDMDRD